MNSTIIMHPWYYVAQVVYVKPLQRRPISCGISLDIGIASISRS